MPTFSVFAFSGRITHRAYRRSAAAALLALLLANLGAVAVSASLGMTPALVLALPLAYALMGGTFVWAMVALSVRRCRDLGWPPAVCLLYLVPVVQLGLPLALALVKGRDERPAN